MANLASTMRAYEEQFGEPIEAIVVGRHYNHRFEWNIAPPSYEGSILTREDGLRILDYDYDSGYGGADCHPFWAWTASRVFFVAEYDGATRVAWLPRHPIAGMPDFSGEVQ